MEHTSTTSSAHTPGPWASTARDDDWHHIIKAPDERGLVIATVENLDDESQESANARLIAAAPQLLEACETCLDDARMALTDEWDRSDDGFEAQIALLEKAIAKAEGR